MRRLGIAVAAATVTWLTPAAALAAPAPVTCTTSGTHHNCYFYPAGNGVSGGSPVQNAAGQTVGYLHQGTNYVYCERPGARVTAGAYYNSNWAWTDADNGTVGWVNAVYGRGGDNDGGFQDTPDCGNAHGQPPGGTADASPAPAPAPTPTPSKPTATPTPKPSAPLPPAPAPGPAPTSCSSTPGAGDNVTRWNPVVVCVLGMLGQPSGADVVGAIDVLIEHESSGNPRAINLWDSNAKAGHPSKGLTQTIPSTFEAHRSLVLADDIYDPAANIYAGLNYGISRYGSILDIPGIDNVLHGRGYVGYAAAQVRGLRRAGSCGRVHRPGLNLALRADGERCRSARTTVHALDAAPAIANASGLVENLSVTVRGRTFLCDVQTATHDAVRVAVCQSGPRTYWWSATKTHHRSGR